jgi:glycolate oxidase
MTHREVDAAIISRLADFVGENNVLCLPGREKAGASGACPAGGETGRPGVLVRPADTAELSRLMRLAAEKRIAVTTVGAGGSRPVHGGILLSLERFNRILELDPEGRRLVVEPAVTVARIQRQTREAGLFYAGDPEVPEVVYIGNCIAGNTRGRKAAKYGCALRHLLGLEVVLPGGEVTTLGGEDAAGYNLLALLAGSRDTLGVITKIHLQLTPLPGYEADLLVVFPDRETAARLAPRIMSGETVPVCLEYMDGLTLRAAGQYLNCRLPHGEAGACLIVGIEDTDEERAAGGCETLGRLCEEHGAVEIFVGDSLSARERIWRPRHCHIRALKAMSPVCCVQNIVAPVARVPGVLREIDRLAGKYGIKIACCGHAGDGHLHAVLLRESLPEEVWQGREHLLEELGSAVRALGGQLFTSTTELPGGADPVQQKMARAIKQALDPGNILNPV